MYDQKICNIFLFLSKKTQQLKVLATFKTLVPALRDRWRYLYIVSTWRGYEYDLVVVAEKNGDGDVSH